MKEGPEAKWGRGVVVRVKIGGDGGETGEPTGHHEDFGSLKRF